MLHEKIPGRQSVPEDQPLANGESHSREENGIVSFAINNPHFMVMACFVVIIMGGLALALLPKDLLPASNQPAVQILSFYPGMPVDRVENNLTARYERYTGQAIGMEHQESDREHSAHRIAHDKGIRQHGRIHDCHNVFDHVRTIGSRIMRLVAVSVSTAVETDHAESVPRQAVDPAGSAPILLAGRRKAMNEKDGRPLPLCRVSDFCAVVRYREQIGFHVPTIAKHRARVYDGGVFPREP